MTNANRSSSPSHPGEILFDDLVDNRKWVEQADEVPETIAWVNLDGKTYPVVRIEITGTPEQRRITKFGEDGQMLETTLQKRR